MTKNLVRRVASLLVLACFALASIGGDGCFDWGNGPQEQGPTAPSPPQCSMRGDQRWSCIITLPNAVMCNVYDTIKCSADFQWTPCALNAEEAENQTKAAAALKVAPGTTVPAPKCAVLSLVNAPTIYNSLVPMGACTCDNGTGGASTGGPSCAANTDACSSDTDCCSGICSDQGACEACRGDNEGCTSDTDCCSGICSLNACGGQALHLHDGGLGFGGGGGSP